MKAEFTTGPWRVFQRMDELVIVARASVAEKNIANIINTGGKSHHANADLIAAAPTMLEALEEIYSHYSYSNKRVSDKAIAMVTEAIEKARGTTKPELI